MMDFGSVAFSVLQTLFTLGLCTLLAFILLNYVTYASDSEANPSDNTANKDVSTVEKKVSSKMALPAEVSTPPVSLLRKKWNVPSGVAKELAAFSDLVMRDFIMSWYSLQQDGSGLTDDSQFLEYLQYIIVDAFGNLSYRAQHLNPVAFVLEDVTEALRYHLYWYEEARRRAHLKQPDNFAPYTDDQLYERAKLRTQTSSSAHSQESEQRDALVTAEKRWILDQQERGILAEYADLNVLHPAAELSDASLLGADPDGPSWMRPPPAGSTMLPAAKAQQDYLRTLVPQLVHRLLPENERQSTGIALIVREIFTTGVLHPMLSAVDPDIINFIVEWAIQRLNEDAAPVSIATPDAPIIANAVSASVVEPSVSAVLQHNSPTSAGVPSSPPQTMKLQSPLPGMTSGLPLAAIPSSPQQSSKIQSPERQEPRKDSLRRRTASDEIITGAEITAAIVPLPTLALEPDSVVLDTAAGLHGADPVWRFYCGSCPRPLAEAILSQQPLGTFLLRGLDGGHLILSYVKAQAPAANGANGTEVAHANVRLEGSAYSVLLRGPFDSLSATIGALHDLVWLGVEFRDRSTQLDTSMLDASKFSLRSVQQVPQLTVPLEKSATQDTSVVEVRDAKLAKTSNQILSSVTFGLFNRKAKALAPSTISTETKGTSGWFGGKPPLSRSESTAAPRTLSLRTDPESIAAKTGEGAEPGSRRSSFSTVFSEVSSSLKTVSSAVADASSSLAASMSEKAASVRDALGKSEANDKSHPRRPEDWVFLPSSSERSTPSNSFDGRGGSRESGEISSFVNVFKPLFTEAVNQAVEDPLDGDLLGTSEDTGQLGSDEERQLYESSDTDEDDMIPLSREGSVVASSGSDCDDSMSDSSSEHDDPDQSALPASLESSLGSNLADALGDCLFGGTAAPDPARDSAAKSSSAVVSAQLRSMSKHKRKWKRDHYRIEKIASLQAGDSIDTPGSTASEEMVVTLPRVPSSKRHRSRTTVNNEQLEKTISAIKSEDDGASEQGSSALTPSESFMQPCTETEVSKALFAHRPPSILVTSTPNRAGLSTMATLLGFSRDKSATVEDLQSLDLISSDLSATEAAEFTEPALPLSASVVRALYKVDADASAAVVRYVVDVSLGPYSWNVKLRFSEFLALHKAIKQTFPDFSVSMPPKKTFLLSDHYNEAFVEGRRAALHTWLQGVLAIPALQKSKEVRTFLAPQSSTTTTVAKKLHMSDKDAVAKRVASKRKQVSFGGAGADALIAGMAEAVGLPDTEATADSSSQKQHTILTAPELRRAEHHIFHLLNELFDLHSSGWMRRQFVGITRTIFRYMYSGSAATSMHDAYSKLISEEQCAMYVQLVRDELLWPGGKWRVSAPPKTWDETWLYRQQIQQLFVNAMPTALSSLLGKDTLDIGVVKLHSFLQIPVLARSLLYTLFDLLLQRLFPGIVVHGLQHPPPTTRTIIPSVAAVRNPLRALSTRLPIASLRLDLNLSKAIGNVSSMLTRQPSEQPVDPNQREYPVSRM